MAAELTSLHVHYELEDSDIIRPRADVTPPRPLRAGGQRHHPPARVLTSLHHVHYELEDSDITRVLLEFGGDVNIPTKLVGTPLSHVVSVATEYKYKI